MIQELKIKNFLSCKEDTVLSFEATKDTTFEDYQVVEVAEGVRLQIGRASCRERV